MESFMMDQTPVDSGHLAVHEEMMDMDPDTMEDQYEIESYVGVDVDLDLIGEEDDTLEIDMVSVAEESGTAMDSDQRSFNEAELGVNEPIDEVDMTEVYDTEVYEAEVHETEVFQIEQVKITTERAPEEVHVTNDRIAGPNESVEQPGADESVEETGFDENVKQTGPDENVEQTGPDESFEQTEPDESVEETGFDENVKQTGPDESVEQTGPDESVEQTGPDENVEQTGPDESVEQTGFDENVEHTGPDENVEQTGPDERVEQTEPDERVEQTGPDERVEQTTVSEQQISTESVQFETHIGPGGVNKATPKADTGVEVGPSKYQNAGVVHTGRMNQEVASDVEVASDRSSTTLKNDPTSEDANDTGLETTKDFQVSVQESPLSDLEDSNVYSYTPPVIVSYDESRVSLFCPPSFWSEDGAFAELYRDVPKDYFLQDAEACDKNFHELFALLRNVLGESVGQDEELVIEIKELGLKINEEHISCHSTSLRQVLDLYTDLCRCDGMAVAYPLQMSLYPGPKFSSLLHRMEVMLEQGKGLGDYQQLIQSEYSLQEDSDSVPGNDRPTNQQHNNDTHPDVEDDVARSKEEHHQDAVDSINVGSGTHDLDSHKERLEIPVSVGNDPIPREPEVTLVHAYQRLEEDESVVEVCTTADDDLIDDEEENSQDVNEAVHENPLSDQNDETNVEHPSSYEKAYSAACSRSSSVEDDENTRVTTEQPSAIPVFEGTDDSRRDEEYFDEENYDESSYEAASTNNDAYIEGFADEQNEGYTQEQYYQDDQETYDQRSCEDGEVFDNQDPEEKVDDSEFDERSGEAGFSSNKPQAKGPHTEGEGNESNNLTGLSAPDLLDDDELLEEDEDVEAVEQEVESVDPTGCTTPQKRLREPEDSDHLSDDHDQVSKRVRSD